MIKAIRGAVSVEKNTKEDILAATKKLLDEIKTRNHLQEKEVISMFFTATPDLNAEFPARAVPEIGWDAVPRICSVEIDVPGSIKKCIRVLIHINSEKNNEINHVYLGEATKLKGDNQQ
jgi:chorismate mutase